MLKFKLGCYSRYGGYNGKLASHISLSQRPDPKENHVISLDQDVQVCGYFWWMVDETPLYEFSFPCNVFGMGYIFLSLSLSLSLFDTPCGCVAYLLWVCIFSLFFWHALWACGIPSLGMHLLFLFVHPIHYDDNFGER